MLKHAAFSKVTFGFGICDHTTAWKLWGAGQERMIDT